MEKVRDWTGVGLEKDRTEELVSPLEGLLRGGTWNSEWCRYQPEIFQWYQGRKFQKEVPEGSSKEGSLAPHLACSLALKLKSPQVSTLAQNELLNWAISIGSYSLNFQSSAPFRKISKARQQDQLHACQRTASMSFSISLS